VIVVQGRYNFLDKRRPQLYFYYSLRATFVAGLNQSVISIARMRNAPVMCVVPQKSQYFHVHALMRSMPIIAIFVPSPNKTQERIVLLQNFS
jgi:hypothetical protein